MLPRRAPFGLLRELLGYFHKLHRLVEFNAGLPPPYHVVLAYMKCKALISATLALSWSLSSSWAFVGGGLGIRMLATTTERTATPTQPMTLTEKLLAKGCGKEYVRPNENVWVNANGLMTHDVCGPGTIGNFYKEFGPDAKVYTRMAMQ